MVEKLNTSSGTILISVAKELVAADLTSSSGSLMRPSRGTIRNIIYGSILNCRVSTTSDIQVSFVFGTKVRKSLTEYKLHTPLAVFYHLRVVHQR
jgi:hypothetical protein